MTNRKKPKNNAIEKMVETEQPTEASDMPPPYVDPIPIPARRQPSSKEHDKFEGHPGPKGKPAEDEPANVVVDMKKEAVGDNIIDETDKAEKDFKADNHDDREYVGVFRME